MLDLKLSMGITGLVLISAAQQLRGGGVRAMGQSCSSCRRVGWHGLGTEQSPHLRVECCSLTKQLPSAYVPWFLFSSPRRQLFGQELFYFLADIAQVRGTVHGQRGHKLCFATRSRAIEDKGHPGESCEQHENPLVKWSAALDVGENILLPIAHMYGDEMGDSWVLRLELWPSTSLQALLLLPSPSFPTAWPYF